MGLRVPTCAVAGVQVPQTVCPRVPCLTSPETDRNSRPPSHPPFLPSPNISPHPPPSYSHSCLHHFPGGGGGGHNRDTQPIMPLPPQHTSDPLPPLHIVSLPSGSLDYASPRETPSTAVPLHCNLSGSLWRDTKLQLHSQILKKPFLTQRVGQITFGYTGRSQGCNLNPILQNHCLWLPSQAH